MIRLRRSAPVTISFGLLLFGLALPAVTQGAALTRAEMEAFVYTVVGTAGAAIFGSFWILLTYINSRTERSVEQKVERIVSKVDDLVSAMRTHHEDPLAHPAGSANRINPLLDEIKGMREMITDTHEAVVELRAEHRVIHDREDEICALVRRTANRKRSGDPDDVEVEKLRS